MRDTTNNIVNGFLDTVSNATDAVILLFCASKTTSGSRILV